MRYIARKSLQSHGPFRAVVAHSFGAMVASALLRENPADFRLAVSVSGVFGSDTLLEGFRNITGASQTVIDAFLRYIESVDNAPFDAYCGTRLVPGIQITALIVHDRKDRDVPHSEAERYLKTWPGAEPLFTEGAWAISAPYAKVIERCVDAIVSSATSARDQRVSVICSDN
jgi:pimeloyl-ACP methyl ester carboxylesterase